VFKIETLLLPDASRPKRIIRYVKYEFRYEMRFDLNVLKSNTNDVFRFKHKYSCV
jgi:hypothetical protein